ncbi:hypothetical protein BDFB_004375 [Asbolus verrucosus]|uniref:DUF4817 domain-containing protein n=1 Tax=Asbolus verrucosus TaxID=1661398 RepID=A0A482W1S2_ASBVE|nr:hypothetical protein BDFB_004375 [Asbolus verrucosus]
MVDNQERREIIFVYDERRRNFKQTSRVLQERNPNVGYSLKIVKKVVRLFEDISSVVKPKRVYHSVRNDNKGVKGRGFSVGHHVYTDDINQEKPSNIIIKFNSVGCLCTCQHFTF